VPPEQQLLDPLGAAGQALWQSLSTVHGAVHAPPSLPVWLPDEEPPDELPPLPPEFASSPPVVTSALASAPYVALAKPFGAEPDAPPHAMNQGTASAQRGRAASFMFVSDRCPQGGLTSNLALPRPRGWDLVPSERAVSSSPLQKTVIKGSWRPISGGLFY
jgi:hypothetical protein